MVTDKRSGEKGKGSDLIRAWEAHQEGKLGVAVELYYQVLAKEPNRKAVINLGSILRSQNRLKEAAEHYKRWERKFKQDEDVAANAANCFLDRSEPEIALDWIREGLVASPGSIKLRQIEVKILINLEELESAFVITRALEKHDPDSRYVQECYSLLYLKQNNPKKALTSLQRCDTKKREIRLLTAIATRKLGHLPEAINILDNFTREEKENTDWKLQKIIAAMAAKDYKEAEEICKEILKQDPYFTDAWIIRSEIMSMRSDLGGACKILKKAILYMPKETKIWENLEKAILRTGSWNDNLVEGWRRRHSNTKTIKSHNLFNLNFLGAGYDLITRDKLSEITRVWEKENKKQQPLWKDTIQRGNKNRRIRIGYLSSDWKFHPVARFMLEVLKNHNRNYFEVWGINGGEVKDMMTDNVKIIVIIGWNYQKMIMMLQE